MSPSARTRPRSGPDPAPAPLPLSVTSSWASSARPATRTSPPPSAKPNTTTTCSSPSSVSQQTCEQEKRLCPQPCQKGARVVAASAYDARREVGLVQVAAQVSQQGDYPPRSLRAVSYTHLRAHETRHDL